MTGECQWLHLDLIANMIKFCKGIFPTVGYAYLTIPTYPSGQIGTILCSKNKDFVLSEPLRKITEEEAEAMGLRYYTPGGCLLSPVRRNGFPCLVRGHPFSLYVSVAF